MQLYQIEWENRSIVPKRISGVVCPDGKQRTATINGNAKDKGYPAYVVVSNKGKSYSVSGCIQYVPRHFIKEEKRTAPAYWKFIPNKEGKNARLF